jgi:hypothetical protein
MIRGLLQLFATNPTIFITAGAAIAAAVIAALVAGVFSVTNSCRF